MVTAPPKPQLSVRPIRTQAFLWSGDTRSHRIIPVDGWTTPSPRFVITSSDDWPLKELFGGTLCYEITLVSSGCPIGSPYEASVYPLEDLAAFAVELDSYCDWRAVRGRGDLNPAEKEHVQYALDRFRGEYGMPAIDSLV